MSRRSVLTVAGRALLLGGALAMVPWAGARAQTSTASLRGYVRGTVGDMPVADAQIELRNTASGIARGATSNQDGFYNISAIQPGNYMVRVRRIGYTPTERTITLRTGETGTLDLPLAQASQQLAAVTIVAAPPAALDIRTTEVASNISPAQIENLPQNNRNFLAFSALAPGIQQRGAGISAGGGSVSNSNLFIDGASFKSDILPGGIAGQDPSLGRTIRGVGIVNGNPFPQNAVQEFRVITQNYKAEYQKATGAVITATTKSGGNEFHGDLFFDGQNQNLLARNYWDVKDKFAKPDYRREQFGGSLGGPIVQDRTHFFASYEGNFQDFQSRVAYNNIPANLPPLPADVLAGQGLYETPLRSNLFFGKIDHQLSDRQSLMFTANVRHDRSVGDFGGTRSAQGQTTINNDVNTYLLRHTYSGQPFTNEAQVSYQQFRWRNEPQNPTIPQTVYENYGVTTGGNVSPQDFRQGRWSLRNDLSWTASSHVVKGGANVDFLDYNINKQLNQNPILSFQLSQPCALSCPYQAQLQLGDPNLKTNNRQVGAYIQDDWTVAPKLLLNLGVRWDYESESLNNGYVTPQRVRDSVTAFVTRYPFFNPANYFTNGTQRKNFYGAFQPRVGFSYDVFGTNRTVVFGGGGLFYDRTNYNVLLDEKYKAQRPSYTFRFSPTGNPTQGILKWDPVYATRAGLQGLINTQAVSPEVFLVNNDTKPPKAVQASLGARHTMGAYQLSVTGTLVNNYNLLRWTFANRDPANGNATVFNKFGVNDILLSSDQGKTRYRALLFQVEKPLLQTTRWGGSIAYTLSKTEANTYSDVDDPFALDYVSPANFGWVPSRFDERHRVVANFVAHAPFGFLVSTVTTLGSGVPYTLSTGCLAPGDFTDPAGFCAKTGQPRVSQFTVDWLANPAGKGPRSERPEGKWFGPFGKWAYRNVDLRFQKDVAFNTQRVSLSFDVYNVFNFTNFNYDNLLYNLRYDGTQNPPRERIPFSTYDSRRAQLGIRYAF